jgi:hypothetical protein
MIKKDVCVQQFFWVLLTMHLYFSECNLFLISDNPSSRYLLHLNPCICFSRGLHSTSSPKPPTLFLLNKGLSWPWSYGSWIYTYLCNRCLSSLLLLFRIPLRQGVQHYVIKFVSDLWQVSVFLWVLRFPPPIRLTSTIYGNWNIVESGIKNYKPNQTF